MCFFNFWKLPSLKVTVRTWKWMVGIPSFPFGMAYFQVLFWFQGGYLVTAATCPGASRFSSTHPRRCARELGPWNAQRDATLPQADEHHPRATQQVGGRDECDAPHPGLANVMVNITEVQWMEICKRLNYLVWCFFFFLLGSDKEVVLA